MEYYKIQFRDKWKDGSVSKWSIWRKKKYKSIIALFTALKDLRKNYEWIPKMNNWEWEFRPIHFNNK